LKFARHRAFTLAEVLIALAIVVVLAALLMVALPAALRSAKSADCASRLASVSRGLMLYGQDYDGLFPPYAFEDYGRFRADQVAFIAALGSYGVSRDRFYCPLDEKAGTDADGEFYSFRNTSYFLGWRVYMNAALGDGGAMLFDPSRVGDPAQLMVFADMSWLAQAGDGRQERVSSHGRRANNLYADGHIKSEPLVQP
jgi:prepilin-type N-terminal cleavage/methylation domain-containing protein/prepilin-type processing-associated H-X9-DG protein